MPLILSMNLIDQITLAEGAGGRRMRRLIEEMFLKYFDDPILARLEDSAEITEPKLSKRFAFTTDSYVVQPIFFPGGDIGKLAICGTVNDLAVKGAIPKYLAVSFIIREGFPISHLERICHSMARVAQKVRVRIVTGDTKVIESNPSQAEIYITTSGVGVYPDWLQDSFGAEKIKVGDLILINGGIGEHETAVLLARGQFDFKAKLKSDCAPLSNLIGELLKNCNGIRMMRDPTRGGLATTLAEIAESADLGLIVDEKKIIIKPVVQGICELLGLDPFYLANEGKVVIVAEKKSAGKILTYLRKNELGRAGGIIGEVTAEPKGVWLKTKLGSLKPLLMLEGQQFPRIC
ncbi:MAG: hydrogenase expression/formation protein HypE [candidate division WOR-3 bacterium]